MRTVDERLRRLWVSALQSRIFNDVLARRVEGGSFDRLLDGDLAYKHDNGACFLVRSAADEQPRCEAFEVSPSGPLFGYRMSLPEGEALRVEQEAFDAAGLSAQDFRSRAIGKVKGARRPLRVRPENVELAGKRFLIHHIINPRSLDESIAARIRREKPHVVVFGHTHKPFCGHIDGTMFFNPGYAGNSRFGMERSLAILHCDGNNLRAEYLKL